jgi:phage shock protein E
MKTKAALTIMILVLITGIYAVCGNREGTEPYGLSVQEFSRVISAQDSLPNDSIFVIDVRTPEEFKAGTAKGAVNMPVQALEKFIPALIKMQKEKPKLNFIIFCRTNNRSCHAANLMLKAGLKNISVAPGWHFWNDENMGKLRVKPE